MTLGMTGSRTCVLSGPLLNWMQLQLHSLSKKFPFKKKKREAPEALSVSPAKPLRFQEKKPSYDGGYL